MAIIKAFAGALGGTFADLWKDIITAGRFDEYVVVAPGVPRRHEQRTRVERVRFRRRHQQRFPHLCARKHGGLHLL
mgnify:CR=1 FL=1